MYDTTASDLEKLLERMRQERESGPAFPPLPFTVPPNGGKIHQQLADAGSVGHGGACVVDAASVAEFPGHPPPNGHSPGGPAANERAGTPREGRLDAAGRPVASNVLSSAPAAGSEPGHGRSGSILHRGRTNERAGTLREPAGAVVFSMEDDLCDTIKPRLMRAPLMELAAEYQVAILCTTHLRGSTRKAVYQAVGNLSFTTAARAVWGLVHDPRDL